MLDIIIKPMMSLLTWCSRVVIVFYLKRVAQILEYICRSGRAAYYFNSMETAQDIVIVGAGIAGLATALGLHRMGIQSLVLESATELRMAGFAIGAWTNAWRALDALGVGDSLRLEHQKLEGMVVSSTVLGSTTATMSLNIKGKNGEHELRCLRRKELLQTLANELPEGSIRFGAKVVAIDDGLNHLKVVQLADGSTLKTKVLIGGDGVNSVVAKSMGLQKPNFTGRCAIRACAEFPEGHSFGSKLMQFTGDGFRAGFIPCNQDIMYWFLTYSPSDPVVEEMDPGELKQFALQTLCQVPKEFIDVVERTLLSNIISSPLKFRNPLSLFWPGAIYQGNVCVTGDALHAMTPDIAQGGCAALEDGVILARCLAEVFLKTKTEEIIDEESEHSRIVEGLKKYADARKWRSFDLICTAYMVGTMQQSSGKFMNFVRDKVVSPYMAGLLLKRADYDCGKLTSS